MENWFFFLGSYEICENVYGVLYIYIDIMNSALKLKLFSSALRVNRVSHWIINSLMIYCEKQRTLYVHKRSGDYILFFS